MPKTEPNPTRAPDAVLPDPKIADLLTDDPEFAPALLPSEEAVVRDYMREKSGTQSAAKSFARRLDPRLWPVGSLILALWIGSLTAVATLRRIRRNRS